MKHIDPKYLSLIFKKLSGQISPQESHDLNNWLKSDEENKRIYSEQEQIFNMTGGIDKQVFDIDVDKEWERFQSRISGAKVFDLYAFVRPAMAVAALIVLFFAFWFLLGPQKTYYAKAQDQQIVLPDRSIVKLRKGSRLVVSHGFDKSTRTVKLKGEAYFIVEHNINKPFRVKANGFIVQVMGTEFYVSQQEKEVFVNKGIVKIGTVKDEEILKAGQSAKISDHTIVKTKVEDKNLIAWATGVLNFEDSPLAEVFQTLEDNYGIRIIVENKDIDTLTLTATFKDKDIDFILEVIAQTEGFKVYKTASKVYVVK